MRKTKLPLLIMALLMLLIGGLALFGSSVQADGDPQPTPTPEITETPSPSPQNEILDEGLQTFCQLDINDLSDGNPFTYQFSAINANNIASFSWNLGDTTTANSQTVTHTYTTTGTFNITLTCTPNAGFGNPINLGGSITIHSAPVASFSLTPGTVIVGMPPYNISTVNASTGGGLAYSWKISTSSNPLDAGFYTSTDQNISYSFNPPLNSLPATYWFHLVITDGAGVSAGASQAIVFNPPAPRANFTLTPIDGIAPLMVTVEGVDLGEGPITTWEWDFDGDSVVDVTGQGPHNYTYSIDGVYAITLTYSGPGGSGTYSRQVGVAPDQDPVDAIFSYELTGNDVGGGIEVCFTNESTGPVATSIWTFGDGNTLTSNDAVVCHIYLTEGLMTVQLYVENDDASSSSSASDSVNVVAAPIAFFTVSPSTNITQGTLIDLDSSGSTGIITSWSWDFNGDGNPDSTEANPQDVNLTSLGNNPIRLTVTGPGGSAWVEVIVVVARLEITCDFTGTLDVLPNAGTQTYQSVIGNDNGRAITYRWTITGNGTGLPLTFSTEDIAVDWSTIGTGAFVVTLEASTADGSACSKSKTVNRSWASLDCQMIDTLPATLYADGLGYTFTADVRNLDGRSVLGYEWYINGVDQNHNSATFNWTNITDTTILPANFTIRYDVLVDNGDSTTSDCFEERAFTVQQWPNLTCNSISGQVNPFPATPDNTTRNYTYTAFISGIAGRPVVYSWTVSDGVINWQSGDQANVTWNATAASFSPGQSYDDSISVSVTVTNPDGSTVTCPIPASSNIGVRINHLTCNAPTGDLTPVVGETVNYSRNVTNIYGRPWAAVNPISWTLEEWNGVAYVPVTTGTTNPFSYTFPTAGVQYRLVYSAAVDGAGNLPADSCTLPTPVIINVTGIGENFACDSVSLSGNLSPWNPASTYAYTIDMDNGNGLNLQYRWVLVDSAGTEHLLDTTTSMANGIITSPAFTMAQLAPLGIDINVLRVDVQSVNYPTDSTYTCSRQATLTAGTLSVNYTYTGNASAIAVNQDICLTNTSTATPGDINSLNYTWDITGDPAYNSWTSNTSAAQQPGCIRFSEPGIYTITLTGENSSTLRSGTRAVTFYVYGLQSIVINRSNQTFAPNTISFTATGTNVSAPYNWEFRNVADNSLVGTQTGATVSQYFGTPGTYRATVSANGPLGTTTASLEFELIAVNQLRAAFTPSQYGGIAPLYVCFTDRSVGTNILTWSWDFDGDSVVDLSYDNNSIPANICYTYTTPGTVYQARLTITNASFTNSATNTIRTYNLLESNASFSVTPQGGGQFCFTANLTGNVTVTSWDFGDNITGPGQTVICHTYGAAGSYLVQMNITDGTNTGTVVRTVVVDNANNPAPAIIASGTCSADRTASFTLTNNGGAMSTPDQVTVWDNSGSAVLIASVQLSAGESQTFSVANLSGNVTMSLLDNVTVTASTTCYYPPEISVASACSANTLPVFTISNARSVDGPMVAPQAYEIRDSSNIVIDSGTFQLTLGVNSLDIAVPVGNDPYETYTFVSNGAVGSFSTPHNCAPQPALNLAGVCAENVAFTISNTSSNDMVLPQSFTIVDGLGNDVTPTLNTFQLVAGDSVTIALTGLNPYVGYTLTSTGFASNLSLTQNCATPNFVVNSICSSPLSFTITNNGGDMLMAQDYEVVDSANVVVSSGSFTLTNNETRTVTLSYLDPYVQYTIRSTGFAGTFDVSQDCNDPSLQATASCSYPVTFEIRNNAADMLAPQGYEVLDADGTVVLTGSFQLTSGSTQTISLDGINPYIAYTLTSDDFAGTLSLTQSCTPPALVASSTCSNPAQFVLTNTGGDMLTAQPFTVTNDEGENVTPVSNTFQLNHGESITISLDDLNPYALYTLATDGFAGAITESQDCKLPVLNVSASCDAPASFLVVNVGGDMLAEHTFHITTTDGQDVTPADNTFQLEASESIKIEVPLGVDVTHPVTFISDDLNISTTGTMLCLLPSAETDTSFEDRTDTNLRFYGLSADVLRLPAWNTVPTCGYNCPPVRLYHTNETGDWEIFRLDGADDVNRQSFRQNISLGIDVDDMSPSLSPNNEWIVFTSNRDGNWEIYVAPVDGDASQIQRVTYNTVAIDTDPVWGPHNFVVFETTRHGHWDLYMVDMTTGEEYRLTENEADDINPYWSPDGSKLVFQSNRDNTGLWQLYELNLATLTVRRLSDGSTTDVDPQYSFDGQHIVYRTYAANSPNSQIAIMDATGENAYTITNLLEDATNAVWSPNDRLIAYQSNLDGDLDVYIYEVATQITRKLTNNNIPDYAPTWLCSADRVLFTSEIETDPDIFEADALPIEAPALLVEEDADQMTFDAWMDIYPQNAPSEENASREGQTVIGPFGEQTSFLRPSANLTEIDLSFDGVQREDWGEVPSCPITQ